MDEPFYQISNNFYSLRSIKAVRKTRPSKGADTIVRNHVISMDPEVCGGAEYCNVWATEEEAAPIVKEIRRLIELREAEEGTEIVKPEAKR